MEGREKEGRTEMKTERRDRGEKGQGGERFELARERDGQESV